MRIFALISVVMILFILFIRNKKYKKNLFLIFCFSIYPCADFIIFTIKNISVYSDITLLILTYINFNIFAEYIREYMISYQSLNNIITRIGILFIVLSLSMIVFNNLQTFNSEYKNTYENLVYVFLIFFTPFVITKIKNNIPKLINNNTI